ncbi:MAG: hypothetical protein ACI8ZB_003776 [Desulforhopalus sp.]
MEIFAATYAKAIDDLSAKIFIPAMICSLFVEIGPEIQVSFNIGFISTYFLIFFLGLISSIAILYILVLASIFLFQGKEINPYIGFFIMPLGFIGLFPEHFGLHQPIYSQVTGVCMLAWSFVLIKGFKAKTSIWDDEY